MRLWFAAATAAALAGCAAPPPAATPAKPTVPAAPSAPVAPAASAPAAIQAPSVPAAATGVALTNPGFESTRPGRRGDPEGWFSFQHAGSVSYRFELDTVDPHGGARSLRIDNVGPEPYGAVAQSVPVGPNAGKVARLSGWLRTRDVSETGAVLTLLVLANGVPASNNFMADAPVKGTTGWQRYTITLPIPQGAESVEVGAMLQGKGSLWLDDFELEFAQR